MGGLIHAVDSGRGIVIRSVGALHCQIGPLQTRMGNQGFVRKEGLILEALPGATFRVRCDEGHEHLAHLSGRMRVNRIRIIPGDRVVMELATADAQRGRIVYRR